DQRALAVVEPAQREEVVPLVVIERRFFAEAREHRVGVGEDRDFVGVVVEVGRTRRHRTPPQVASLSQPTSRRNGCVRTIRPVNVAGSAVQSRNAVSVIKLMSSVLVFARSSASAPSVATGSDGAAEFTAMPSAYSSAARLPVRRSWAAFAMPY